MNDPVLVTLMCLTLMVTIPSSLGVWIISLLSSGQSPSPSRILCSLLIPAFFTGYGFRRGSVNVSGALAGFLVAFILTMANAAFVASLIVFFIIGSRATKFKSNIKRKIEHDYEKSSRRNWLQALCNCGIAGQLAVIYLFETNIGGEVPIDFNYHYTCSWASIGVLASFACAFGDTLASELGSVLSSGDPFLITTLRRVPRGTNGGVSLIGLAVSALGGLIIGLTYYLILILFVNSDVLSLHPDQTPIIWIGLISGLVGSIIDSFIGAIFQFSGQDKKTGHVVEIPGPNVIKISGFPLLDNHAVNLLSTFIIGMLAPLFTCNYFSK